MIYKLDYLERNNLVPAHELLFFSPSESLDVDWCWIPWMKGREEKKKEQKKAMKEAERWGEQLLSVYKYLLP